MNEAGKLEAVAANVLVDRAGGELSDQHAVDVPLRCSVIFALRVYNSQILEGHLTQHIQQAFHAQTVGQIRRIVAAADRLLHGPAA